MPVGAEEWFTTDSGHADAPATGQVWNLSTGEHRSWTRNPAAVEIWCGPLWCGGVGANGRPAVQKLDGSGYVELPGGARIDPAHDGRLASFIYAERSDAIDYVLWDLSTGRAAAVALPGRTAAVSRGGGYGFQVWEQDGKLLLLTYAKMT